MTVLRGTSHVSMFLMMVAALAVAFVIGFYVGNDSVQQSAAPREVHTRMIDKGGDPNHGKSCEPKGKYGKVKKPKKHCPDV